MGQKPLDDTNSVLVDGLVYWAPTRSKIKRTTVDAVRPVEVNRRICFKTALEGMGVCSAEEGIPVDVLALRVKLVVQDDAESL